MAPTPNPGLPQIRSADSGKHTPMALRLILGFVFSLIYGLVGGMLISALIMKITGNLSSKEGGDSYSTLLVGAFLAMASVVVTAVINVRLKDDIDRIAAIYAQGIMAAVALATVFAHSW